MKNLFWGIVVGIAILSTSNWINSRLDCVKIYEKLDKMSVEKTVERLDLEKNYFNACLK